MLKNLKKFLMNININNRNGKFLQYFEIDYLDEGLFTNGAIINRFCFIYYSDDIIETI